MEGEDEDSDNPRAFNNKPAWQRFIIVAAGAILNLILGIIVVGVCISMQNLVGSRVVHSFDENAISCNYGLKAGDEIIVHRSAGIKPQPVSNTRYFAGKPNIYVEPFGGIIADLNHIQVALYNEERID